MLTGLLAGFYPALVLSGFKPVAVLYGKFRPTGRNYLSKGLVVLQFALAGFLITATGIMYSQLGFLQSFDPGYNDKNVLVLNVNNGDIFSPGKRVSREQLSGFRNELLAGNLAENVSGDQGAAMETTAKINDAEKINFDIRYTDENYLSLLQIPLTQGRNFSGLLHTDTASAVLINEAFARAAGWTDAVGKQIDFSYLNKKYTVVGVVKDYHYGPLTEKTGPQLLMMNPAFPFGNLFIKLKKGNPAQSLAGIESVFKKFFPDLPYWYNFMEARHAAWYADEARWKKIISYSSLLTIIISCIGLFGLAGLSARKRSKEIGIRKVLGASVTGIAAKLCAEFSRLVAIAVVISWPFAGWVMNRWLQNYPYHTRLAWWMFCLPAFFILLVAVLTTVYQSVKAAMANPVKSLRTN